MAVILKIVHFITFHSCVKNKLYMDRKKYIRVNELVSSDEYRKRIQFMSVGCGILRTLKLLFYCLSISLSLSLCVGHSHSCTVVHCGRFGIVQPPPYTPNSKPFVAVFIPFTYGFS